jgi:hypothetical protein
MVVSFLRTKKKRCCFTILTVCVGDGGGVFFTLHQNQTGLKQAGGLYTV